MKSDTTRQDIFECQQLTAAYCHLIDHGEATRTADLFTDDAVIRFTREDWTGKDQIRAGMGLREAKTERISRHVCNNFHVTSVREDKITATTYLSLYRADAKPGEKVGHIQGPAVLGEYEDTFVRTPSGWRIAQRICRIDLIGPK